MLPPAHKRRMIELLAATPISQEEANDKLMAISKDSKVPLPTVRIYWHRLQNGVADAQKLIDEADTKKKALSPEDKKKLLNLIRKKPDIAPSEVLQVMDIHPRTVWYYKKQLQSKGEINSGG